MTTAPSTARYRPVTFGVTRVSLREGAPGVRYLQADLPLGAFARRVTDYLVHWAETTPDHSFLARREQLPGGKTGDWQHVSYAQALDAARRETVSTLIDIKVLPKTMVHSYGSWWNVGVAQTALSERIRKVAEMINEKRAEARDY